MRCLVIDDEFSARSRLKRLLTTHSDLEVVGEAEDGVQGLEQITSLKPDLIFLDIEMPQLNGFQMLRAIPADDPLPLIIFTTGYDEHALAAFEADALAYLLKPIEEHRLATALSRSSNSSRTQSAPQRNEGASQTWFGTQRLGSTTLWEGGRVVLYYCAPVRSYISQQSWEWSKHIRPATPSMSR